MLEVVFDFMRQGIIPWDAKLDNLGLAKRGAHGKWVTCDLDGLRVWGRTGSTRPWASVLDILCGRSPSTMGNLGYADTEGVHQRRVEVPARPLAA